MFFEEKGKQLSDFPKREQGKPGIFVERVGSYPCFCIHDIYLGLFEGAKTKSGVSVDSALIWFPNRPHTIKTDKKEEHKALLKFILPLDLFELISHTSKDSKGNPTKDGEPYVKDYDYREFFLKSTNNNKITKLLFRIFSTTKKDAEKTFIESIQTHFIQTLKNAEYQQPQLNEYLCNLVDNGMAPIAVSSSANKAFHSLVDSGKHDAISKAIANIFISSMLGLYSMKYSATSEKPLGYKRQRDYVFVRTYLLNKMGMECIWSPETINNSYVLCSYECGRYEEAYAQALLWLAAYGGMARNHELASALYVLGACLYQHPAHCNPGNLTKDKQRKLQRYFPAELLGEGDSTLSREALDDKKRSTGIAFLEESVSLDKSQSEAFYLLYEYYKERKEKRADECLKASFDHAFVKAVLEVARRCNKAPSRLKDVAVKTVFEKLTAIISAEQNYSKVDVSECLYLRGRLRRITNTDAFAAENDFINAADKGHEKARQELSRKKRMEQHQFPSFSEDANAPRCFANSLNGNNLTFLSTFPEGKWALFTSEKHDLSVTNTVYVRDAYEFIETQRLEGLMSSRPPIVFLFMSTDKDQNLNECLMLLDRLFNIALEVSAPQRYSLIDSIDIYIEAKFETASMLIDASINDMGNDIYFKVHIVDETRDAVHQLLCDAPLFIPLLNKPKHDDSVHVVLFGCSELNYRFMKESIGCAYLGKEYPVSITMLGTQADSMERRLRQECPGLFHEPYIACIRPKFLSCCIEEEDFPNLIYGSEYLNYPDHELVKALRLGNYFVIDLSRDHDSIQFAMELRTWLLRSRGTFDRTPFIAVKCKNSQNSYLATHLTLTGQAAGNTYYSRFDLFPFGMSKEMYSFHKLIENPRLEEVALQIHKSYYGGNDRQAENDYYSFSYHADSSLSTAIGLSYRLFAGGAFFPDKEQYLHCGVLDENAFFDHETLLLDQYFETINGNDELAAALEQSRWNGFMLSRGWESADASQVRAYKDQSTGSSHKHTLAKLHPFIREWADLAPDKMNSILEILEAKFAYNKFPQETTRQSIHDMPKFLGKSNRHGEKTR